MPTKFAEKNSFTSPANRKNKPLGGKLSGGASLAALAAGLALGGGVLSAPSAYALAGIVATGNGHGPLTVSAPALVTESNGDGIKATNYGTDLTVTATDVSGSQDGIDARNYGTGELSVTSTGTVTGSTFDGINVLNYYASNGNVNIDVADVTGETSGIFARNYGAGSIYITSSGDVTGITGSGIAAQHMYNSGTDLVITTTGAVSGGSRGIDVQHGGTGILSITSTGDVTGAGSRGISAVNSQTSDDITITAANVSGVTHGIFATNQGSGSLSVTSNGAVTGLTGIRAGNTSSAAGDVAISAASVVGQVDGIFAFNGGSGTMTVSATGPVTGVGGIGIRAEQNNVNATGNLTISVADVTGGIYGISAVHDGTGALSVTSSGAGVTGGTDGIRVVHNGTGALSVTSSGVVNGSTGMGISALSASNSIGDQTILVDSVNGGLNAIENFNYGTGAVSVTATGSVSGGEYGILSYNYATGTDLTISVLNASGGFSGISARNTGTGALSVSSTGTISGGLDGLFALLWTSGTDLTISAASVTGSNVGINARSEGQGTLSVTTSGAISGGTGAGIQTTSNAGGAVAITLLSTSSVSSTSGVAIEDREGDAVVTINAGAVVNGSISLGDGNDTLNIMAGTSLAGVTSLNGGLGSFVDTLNLNAGLAGTLSEWEILNVNTAGGDFSITGAISNIGVLTKSGAGTLTLTGNNSFIGGTTISAGSLIGDSQSFGDGDIVNNASLVLNQTTDASFALVISGTGSLTKSGAGALTLTGVNSFSGGTTISAGRLIGNTQSFGTGAIVNNASLVFNQTSNASFASVISGTGSLTKTGGGVLTLTGINSFTGGTTISSGRLIGNSQSFGSGAIVNNASLELAQTTDASFASVISGTGSLTKSGAGALTLTGVNSFSGGTTISAGRLIGNTQSFGTGAIVNNASLVFNQTTDASFASVISGTGSLTKSGAGALTLTGVNSFSGGTTISAGTLIGNSRSFGSGAIVNNAALVLDQTTDASFASVISGTGSLTKSGTGALTLTGINSFSGGTTISAGTLIGNVESFGTGAIVNNASLVFDQTSDASFASVISGTGSLTKSGAGSLTLTGVNGFSGGTTISSGSLIGNTQSFGTGAIVNDASLVLNQTTDASFAGAISGTGSLTKSGAGTLTLTGVNSFTGTTTVTAGRLNLAGSLAVSTTTLQSGSSLGASGTAGSLARSALTLQSGSSLGGNGTVGTLVAQSGSTVSPGNSIGTLSVNGNLTLAAGSLLAIEVAPSGADMVTVTGTANLAGNLTITPSAGQYSFFQRFTLVSANTVTGTFANSSLGDFGSKFLPKLVYDATSVALRLDPKSLVEVSGGTLRGNALGFATAFDTAVFAGYNPDRFVNLYAQGADLAGALGQFTGERFSAERQAAMQSTHVVRDAAFAALNDDLVHAADTASESKYAGDTLTTVWMRAAGSWGTVKADGTASRYKTDQTAVLTGIDVSSGGFKLGGMVSQSSTDVNLYSFGQSNIESVGATVYAGYRGDTSGFAVGFGAGFASNSALGSRAITVPTLAQVLIGKTKSTSLQYFAEASYDFAGSANSRIEPFARIARVELDSKAFAETGGSAAVHGDKQSNSRTMAGAGIRGAHASANMTLTTSIGWQRTIGDLSAPTNLELTLIDTSYEVHSAAFDRNAVTLDTQASFRLSSHMMFGIGYNALAGKNNRSHGARATIRYAF